MAQTHLPSTDSAGRSDVNDTYTINNDYVYPRYTVPAIFDQAGFVGGTFSALSPFRQMGLLRGYLYPVDLDASAFTAASAESETAQQELALSTSERACAEAVEAQLNAAREAARATGQNVPEALLQPAGPGGVLSQSSDPIRQPKKIRYTQGKQFQFNPFAVSLEIAMIASAPPETLQTEGTASSQMVGSATTNVKLYFDRSIETAAATGGRTTVNGYTIDPVFADIGVQKDLWDVYRIILGGDEEYYEKVGGELVNVDPMGLKIHPGSGTDMFTRLFDIGLTGSKAYTRRIALYYNPNLVIIGEVTGISFTYAEFNANYVPTKAIMDIGLLVFSTTSESGFDTANGATDSSTDSSTDDGTDNSEDETQNASTVTTRRVGNIIVTTTTAPNGATTNTYRVVNSNTQLAV